MAPQVIGLNDKVLLGALLYSSVDLALEWDHFDRCHWPIHKWLMVSYVTILALRLSNLVGITNAEEGGHFLLNLRQRTKKLRLLVSITWCAALPFFAVWTALGTKMLLDVRGRTPSCLPSGGSFEFIALWQFLSYAWISVHAFLGIVAWALEHRVRDVENDLRVLEGSDDGDMASRWGRVSHLTGYVALPARQGAGLTPAEIAALPSDTADDPEEGAECPICLNEIKLGERIRTLGACGHRYHKSCLDLWLLRQGDCPLCKREVRGMPARPCRARCSSPAPAHRSNALTA